MLRSHSKPKKVIMTIEKDRSHSPVHLHVDDATPVHVHVKKPKKAGGHGESSDSSSPVASIHTDSSPRSPVGPAHGVSKSKAASFGASNLRRSTVTTPHSRSKSPISGPWVPPPGKSSKGVKYSWQGANHRLEISNPQDAETIQNTLRLSDLSTDDEDRVHNTMRQYEKKIDGLMTEVGSLKNEVELQRTLRQIEAKEDELNSSRQVLEDQERELNECKWELRYTEAENEMLRRSRSRSPQPRMPSPSRLDSEHLMKKLVEVEMDGQAAAKQTAALKDTIRRLRDEKRLSQTDHSLLTKQKDLVMGCLADFEGSNRSLRRFLRDRHEEEAAALRLTEQRDLLLKKLSETEDTVQRLKTELLERDRQVTDCRLQIDAQKEENMAISGVQSSLESNRAHLQRQLRQKDGDCNRMAVQIRNLRSELASAKGELEALKTVQQTELFDRRRSSAKFEDMVFELKDKVSAYTSENKTLTSELASTKGQLQALQSLQHNEAVEQKRTRDKLQDHLTQLRDENVVQKREIKSLESELSSTRGQLEALQSMRQTETEGRKEAMEKFQELMTGLRQEVVIQKDHTKAMETQLAQERIEVDHLQGLLKAAKEKAEHDKEALKKATRAQKQRATRSEDALETLNAQILERDQFIEELRSEMENTGSQCDKIAKEKSQMQAENSALNTRVGELESIMARVEESCKKEVEATTSKLQDKTTEIATLRLENERLKTSISTIEEKLKQADGEVSQLRSGLKQYETLVDEYRQQMNRSRREADETMIQLEEQKRETGRVTRENEMELEKVKGRLQTRLAELEPIPELLKTTELRLQDANEKLLAYEKRNTDNTKLIAELTAKVEHQSDHLEQTRDKMMSLQDENRGVMTRSEVLDRKLRDLEEQNRDLLQTCAKREETIHQLTLRLEEKTHESSNLGRQLEASLSDTRRLTESAREKVASKERTSQSRILDLESQLSALRAENARVKREREEAERKFNSRLYDLKDRLEQSHSTNRSMQNYVQFLKSSYANVFGDTTALAGSTPGRTTFPY